ncbi:lipid A core-O-antigen ligase-like enyme [Mycolicibacterium chubuense NBB4]|uniref:Lipid A core-O-antigen ligase-like enyme n=1 Tax=Mycolicibacterium chubuense (strain NBB4) TaxID=710421 RepID=I4BFM8_MYCCN|nr:O-antigen ligase family protein [Mycolicibacterium chubuense]AFM16085.1 lipid A core-O-antigen ligase-like enyme [Mycolicibacterium chubuense NBB4]
MQHDGSGASATHTVFVPAPPYLRSRTRPRLLDRHLLALLIIMSLALAVVPEVITHLNVKHSPDLPPLEDDSASSKFPLAHLASLGGSALLLALSSFVVLMKRGHPNRNIGGVLILLLAVNIPYVLSPALPAVADLPKIALANLFVLALWKTGASIDELKWVPIIVAGIGVYSLIGGLIIPDYMMYNIVSEKAIIGGWELAGPFGHGNVLGMYCAVAFSLVPLIPGRRWQVVCGMILFTTALASASRTAVIASVLVALWWLICRFRSVISIRFVGTVFVSAGVSAMLVLPFLNWDPHAFTDRASVWAASLGVWQHSPLVGLGVNWFLTDAKYSANVAVWAYVGTGHNLVVDTLVKSGVIGVVILAPVLVTAIVAARALRLTNQQIALFGYLGAFFVAAATEAVWALLPNLQLFPISGLIFAMLILSRHGDRAEEGLL